MRSPIFVRLNRVFYDCQSQQAFLRESMSRLEAADAQENRGDSCTGDRRAAPLGDLGRSTPATAAGWTPAAGCGGDAQPSPEGLGTLTFCRQKLVHGVNNWVKGVRYGLNTYGRHSALTSHMLLPTARALSNFGK